MSLKNVISKNKGALSRVALLIGSFMFLHYVAIPRLVMWKYGLRYGRQMQHGLTDPMANVLETLMYYKPLDVVTHNEVWQVVNDPIYEVYLYSAFFDDRKILPKYHIRVTGFAENSTRGMICLLWYRNRKEPDTVAANITFVGEAVEQQYKWFQGILMSCEIPSDRWPPESVSIISKDSIVPSNLLKVSMPYKPPMQKDFAVCVPVIYGEIKEGQFSEWVEVLKHLGVSKIFIYDNGLASSILKIVKHYISKGEVELRKAPFAIPNDNQKARTLLNAAVLNDCFYTNMMEYTKVIIMDIDELIMPRLHDSYSEMVTYIDDTLPNHPGWSYTFRNVYFWLDFDPFTEDTPFMIMTRYLMRTPPSVHHGSDRSITDTQVCLAVYINQCWEILPQYNNLTEWLVPVNMNVSMKHHYKHCHLDTFYNETGLCNQSYALAEVDATGTKFVDKVTTQVVETLWRFDLVDIFNLAENSLQEALNDELVMNGTVDDANVTLNATDFEIDVPSDPSILLSDSKASIRFGSDKQGIKEEAPDAAEDDEAQEVDLNNETPDGAAEKTPQTFKDDKNMKPDKQNDNKSQIDGQNNLASASDNKHNQLRLKLKEDSNGITKPVLGTMETPKMHVGEKNKKQKEVSAKENHKNAPQWNENIRDKPASEKTDTVRGLSQMKMPATKMEAKLMAMKTRLTSNVEEMKVKDDSNGEDRKGNVQVIHFVEVGEGTMKPNKDDAQRKRSPTA